VRLNIQGRNTDYSDLIIVATAFIFNILVELIFYFVFTLIMIKNHGEFVTFCCDS